MSKKLYIGFLFIFIIISTLFSVENSTCLECHSDKDLTAERGRKEISMFVNVNTLKKSVHKDQDCVNCHEDADVEDFPHPEKLKSVNCGNCHEDINTKFQSGIHGRALKLKHQYAPTCKECHGTHTILSPKDNRSRAFRLNAPYLCGNCHREGAPVARVYNISEKNIIENYSQSIHGVGLFKKGLIVTATCIDCHGSHHILPHTDKISSIYPGNIAKTCMKCHSRIEEVHVKIIENKKWERAPGTIPACTDCHLPHKVRKESIVLRVSDKSCQKCHEKAGISIEKNGKRLSLTVHKNDILSSSHSELTCVKCHSDVDPRLKRPCKTANKVNCSSCHVNIGDEYRKSGHGVEFQNGNKDAPECTTCHGTHLIKPHLNDESPVYKTNIPVLCGRCHNKESKIKKIENLDEPDAINDYSKSIHGRQLRGKGFLVSASCTDCHNKHLILNHKNPDSSVNEKNIPATCSTCHRGIYMEYRDSVHFSVDKRKMNDLPTCTTCHTTHKISDVKMDKFMKEVTHTCGSCHKDLSKSYMNTMHGKTYQLGYQKSAKCSDCHNSHHILKVDDPESSVGYKNIVNTCRKCHEDANKRFTGYLTHATHHDRKKYPILFYTYWAMTFLLLSVFIFFGIHTLLWFPRSFKTMKQKRELRKKSGEKYIKRFLGRERVTHMFVILSFFALAFTGLLLKFSSMKWAALFVSLLGGVEVAGMIHRFAAFITFGYFISHLFHLNKKRKADKQSWFKFIFSKNSMMFNKKDFKDFFATMKWFIGLGKRPDYGRWTYWEKFDYFAVFWGVFIIGSSGLLLWFPEFFTNIFPGWLINVATIIHSDEALLAIGFIFTIHFFNTHLRPESFPMDKVIFTGLLPLEEFKNDRPIEYQEMKKNGTLEKNIIGRNKYKKYEKWIFSMGMTFLFSGIFLVLLILYSMLFGYK